MIFGYGVEEAFWVWGWGLMMMLGVGGMERMGVYGVGGGG